MALAGMDFLTTREFRGFFGFVDLDITTSSVSTEGTEIPVTKPATTEKPSEMPLEETSEKMSVPPSEDK